MLKLHFQIYDFIPMMLELKRTICRYGFRSCVNLIKYLRFPGPAVMYVRDTIIRNASEDFLINKYLIFNGVCRCSASPVLFVQAKQYLFIWVYISKRAMAFIFWKGFYHF